MTILTFTPPQALFVLFLFAFGVSSFITFLLLLKKLGLQTVELVQLRDEYTERDKVLNYVLKTFNLTAPDPYVQRPVYTEKRCYHCHIPEGFKHADDCPWFLVRPMVTKLYGK